MKFRHVALLLAPLLLVGHAASAETLMAIIQKNDDAFAKAFNAGDGTAISNLYTADATILPPGAEMQHGRPAIATFWQGAIQSGLRNASLTAMFVEAYGPVAREIGHFSFDAPGQTPGQTGKVEGKYVVMWRKVDGRWMLDTDIWNMNK
jgi:uncharacterized protein (TIGR02246 family)